MSTPVSDDGFVQTVVRLHATMIDRIDAHTERVRAKVPGVAVSRAATIRSLLLQALEAAEAQAAAPAKPTR